MNSLVIVKINNEFILDYKKLFNILIIFCFSILLFSCSGTKFSSNTNSLKKLKYFKILADAEDDQVFVKLQDDLNINPKLGRYTVIIDIRSSESSQQYLLFGDEYYSKRYMWSQISEDVQKGLINWTGSNKESME